MNSLCPTFLVGLCILLLVLAATSVFVLSPLGPILHEKWVLASSRKSEHEDDDGVMGNFGCKETHFKLGLQTEKVSLPSLLPPSHGSSFPVLLSPHFSSLPPQSTGRLRSPEDTEEGTEGERRSFAASDPRFERAASFMTFVACMEKWRKASARTASPLFHHILHGEKTKKHCWIIVSLCILTLSNPLSFMSSV